MSGTEVHHKNRKHNDDRIANLQKLTAEEHRLLHVGDLRPRARVKLRCVGCKRNHIGAKGSKFCSEKCARDHRNRRKSQARAEASKHTCANCTATIYGRAIYCKAKECQRRRNTLKQGRWAAKPETKKHLGEYRRKKKSR